MKRLLATGSRDWSDQVVIVNALWNALQELGPCVLVHGDCPTGADALADLVWATNQYPVERHPALWKQHKKAAGFIRNKEMVDLGADLCLAFIKNNSKGTLHTVGLAEKAGIPVRRFLDG